MINAAISLREFLIKCDDCSAASFMLWAALIVLARWPISSPRAPTCCQDNARKKAPFLRTALASEHGDGVPRFQRKSGAPSRWWASAHYDGFLLFGLRLLHLWRIGGGTQRLCPSQACRRKETNLFLILVKSITEVLFWRCSHITQWIHLENTDIYWVSVLLCCSSVHTVLENRAWNEKWAFVCFKREKH